MLSYKIFIVIAEGFCLILTQPSFTVAETKQNKDTDKFSILFIFLASSLSVVFAEIEWAYLPNLLPVPYIPEFVGLVMILAGLGIRLWAIFTLGKHFTATARLNKEHELIQTGPYAFVRHPSYTGAFLCIVGVSVFLNAVGAAIISVILMLTAYYVRIKSEEAMLVSFFGERYTIYASKRKKLIPYIW
jgi:protein-S-isoprenylcysteine O-methyltransferase Ste14